MEKFSFRDLTQVYALLVCLVMILVILISLALALDNIASYTVPEIKAWNTLKDFESNEFYRRSLISYAAGNEKRQQQIDAFSDEELTTKRLADKTQTIQAKKAEGISGLISSLQWLFLSAAFFYAHWRLATRRARALTT